MASSTPAASGQRRFVSWAFGVFFALMALISLVSSFPAALLLLLAAAVTLPPTSRRLQQKIAALSHTWVRVIVVVIAFSTAVRLMGGLEEAKLQTQQPSLAQQTSSASRVRTPMIFDVPSLIGMTVSEVKTALGKPTETSKRINADDHDAYILYTRDGQDLMVSYDYGSNIVRDFFLSTDDSSGKTQDTTRLMDRANLSDGDARYRVEFVKVLNDSSSYTGVKIVTAAVAQHEDDLQKKTNDAKKYDAYVEVCMRHEVEGMLKAPSTAKFPWADGTPSYNAEKNVYTMASYVDAQNAYGAMIRTNYACEVIFDTETKGCATNCKLYE